MTPIGASASASSSCAWPPAIAGSCRAAGGARADPGREHGATAGADPARPHRTGALASFFEFCSFDHSFVELRRRTRQDLEVTGNAYWEVLRNAAGEVARLVYVPSFTMRLLPLDADPVPVEESVRISPVTLERVTTRQRMRRFLQVQYKRRTFFKAFGDPRFVSRTTGQPFICIEALRASSRDDSPATEILHFAIPSPRSPYGIPRWVGGILAVMGSRQMEEVNYMYFENKSLGARQKRPSSARET